MSFWLLMIVLCSAAAVAISVPLIRRLDAAEASSADVAVYRDQLNEVERDLQSGTINAPEAEAARSEIKRRLDRALKHQTAARPLSASWRNLAFITTAGVVILGSVSLYSVLGSPELPSAARQPAAASTAPTQMEDMVAKVTARLKTNPSDAEGWRMLGLAQFNAQRFPESADAYAKALALDPENTNYKSAYAEALVQVAQGIVTPKAQQLIVDVLAKDAKEPRARFYDALAREQAGDQAGALDRWLALLKDTPAEAGWRDDVRRRIAELAKATGRDVSAALGASIAPPLSEDQKAAVKALPEADQQKMIETMVGRLAARLASNPKDIEGWTNLMRAYKVLNDRAKAQEAKANALLAFDGDTAGTAKIKAAAAELGID